MVGGRGVVLLPSSVVRDGELFLAIVADESVRGERLEARVRLASRIERGWIEEDLASLVEERDEVVFDAATGKVRAFRALHYLDLPLEDPREVRPDRAQAEVLLASALPGVVPDLVGKDPALASFLVRSRCLAAWMPELELPDLSTTALAGLLRPFCAGMRSLHDLTKQGILTLVKRSLSSRQLAALDLQAPETIEVPTGSRIRLVYEEGKPPVLAVRLQEMFGCATTPRVAAGRVPVVLHLLGPNFRPVQVTQDLESFWSSTYAQVKKDLRGRYPKHAWPEDPLAASPVRGAKKRKS
jgi:ATP-dependent helicase HrpB